MFDETAKIHPSAKIADDVKIGPWSVIGANVEIGSGTEIGPQVVIEGPTKIGKNNKIFSFAFLGGAPQSIRYKGEPTELIVGDNNIIREFSSLHRGTTEAQGITRIGNNNYLMAYVHVAHDCQVGSHIVFANNAALGGHVVVDDHANFGGFSAVHQNCRVGAYAFVSGETSVVKDVPPYILVSGHPGSVYGLNVIGLKRKGFSESAVAGLKRAYSVIYRKGYTIQQALEQLEMMLPELPEAELLIHALNNSTRGIVR